MRARVHPLQFGYCFMRVGQYPLRGRVHSFEGGVHPLQFGYCFHEGWAVSV